MMKENETKKSKRNNKGFSMMELIVVVAIMSLLVGLIGYGVSMITAGDTKRASKTISGEISTMRTNTLAVMGQWQYEIANDGGSVKIRTYKDGVEQDYTNLGSKIRVKYRVSENASEVDLNSGQKLILTFVQSSGKVNDLQLTSGDDVNKASTLSEDHSIKGSGCCEFQITVASGKKAEGFKLYYETGKIVMN